MPCRESRRLNNRVTLPSPVGNCRCIGASSIPSADAESTAGRAGLRSKTHRQFSNCRIPPPTESLVPFFFHLSLHSCLTVLTVLKACPLSLAASWLLVYGADLVFKKLHASPFFTSSGLSDSLCNPGNGNLLRAHYAVTSNAKTMSQYI